MDQLLQRLSVFGKTLCLGLVLSISTPLLAIPSIIPTNNSFSALQNFLELERQNAGLKSKALTIGNVTWKYSEGGSSQKPSVLLIHGLAGNRDNWNKVAQYLTPYYHVIIPDLPTNEDIQIPKKLDMSVPSVSSELRQFVEAIHIENNLNIAGHSLGGSIATYYASQYPFDTQSLFLLSSAGIYKEAKTSYALNPSTLKNLVITKPGDLDHVLSKLMQSPPRVSADIKSAQEKLLISQALQTTQLIDQIIKLNQIYTPETFARLTRSVEAPTLILWGKQDQIINYEVANELQHLFKRAETPIILNNVGHMPILEAENLVAQSYLPFLSKTQNLKNPLADKLIPLN
ncbi:alpha/beta hydrolase [Acinetobacter sp. ANC 4558]|uniref:alpha/beta fold hydrolase n=1 Tax=Acinetobacter sp. ANC 4558 TaxID=1977876 RepID=UPI000A35BD68|nr:alpha/beta hydrolase [Acinetobacter sp. ANC 4558]OTG87765.1 alpha/beta hydrolase [Acinetobacter sp. ANC 4558]